jgi:large subunit ribosomal protein L25
MSATLTGKIREGRGKSAARAARREELLPGVLYGMQDNVSFTIIEKELKKILHAEGKNVLIDLNIEGDAKGKSRKVVLKDYQTHPLKANWRHVDFLEVDESKKIHVQVSFVFKGKSPGEKQGGIVNHLLDEIEVECLPSNILSSIEIDMTVIGLGDVLHVSDLKLPATVNILTPLTTAIVGVMEAKEEVAKAEVEEEDTDEAKPAEKSAGGEAKK